MEKHEGKHSKKGSLSGLSSLASAAAIIILIILIIYLLINLVIYFLERNQPLLSQTDSGTIASGRSGNGTNSALLSSLLAGTAGGTGSTSGSGGGSSTGTTSNTTPTTIVNSNPGTPTSYQPMVIYVPQNSSGQPGSNSQQTTIVNPGGQNPGTNGSPSPSGNTTNTDDDTETTTNTRSRTLLSNLGVDPNVGVDPALSLAPAFGDASTDLSGLSADVLADIPVSPDLGKEILPDNPLSVVKDFNDTLESAFIWGDYNKTIDYLTRANDKMLQGLLLLQKDSGDRSERIALETFREANKLSRLAERQIQRLAVENPQLAKDLSVTLIRSLAVQQNVLTVAENIGDISVSNEIENIRIEHLADMGVVLKDVLSISDNQLTVLPILVNSMISTPIQTLATLNLLNDLENTANLSAQLSPVRDILVDALATQLLALPEDQRLPILLAAAGRTPIRIARSIENLDMISQISDDVKLKRVVKQAIEGTVFRLDEVLATLPTPERVGAIDQLIGENIEDLRLLSVIESHLRHVLPHENSAETLAMIVAAKQQTLAGVVTSLNENADDLSVLPYVNRLLTQPDPYDLALLSTLQNVQNEVPLIEPARQALTQTQDEVVNQLVGSVVSGTQPATALIQDLQSFPEVQPQVLQQVVEQVTNQPSQVVPNVVNQVNNTVTQPVTNTVVAPVIEGVGSTVQNVVTPLRGGGGLLPEF